MTPEFLGQQKPSEEETEIYLLHYDELDACRTCIFCQIICLKKR